MLWERFHRDRSFLNERRLAAKPLLQGLRAFEQCRD
jgi:hypothetical protein